MITKDEFVKIMNDKHVDLSAIEHELQNFERIAEAATKAHAAMPGIGFASVRKRLNCFIAVCRHLDNMIDNGELDLSESQLVLMILRIKDKKFLKAITMFELRAPQFNAKYRSEMPRTAREYLAGISMFG